MTSIDTRTKLSALWLFILLNIIFRDIHQMTKASHLEMLLTGYYNGVLITDELMLLGGFLVQIPIAMVLFSLLLVRNIARPLTLIAAILTTGTLFSTAPTDLDDTFHLIIELIAMAAIVWTAWAWREHASVSA